MKKVYSCLFVLSTLVVLLAVSCKKDDDPRATLSVKESSLTFAGKHAEAQTVEITTSADSWEAVLKNSADEAWLKLAPSKNILSIKPEHNTDNSNPRTAIIVVTAGNAIPVEVTVTQAPYGTNTLSVAKASVSYAAGVTGEQEVGIASDADSWDATTQATWMQLIKKGMMLTINVTDVNKTADDRSAEITVTAGNAAPVTLTVFQNSVNVFNTGVAAYHETSPAIFLFDVYNSTNTNVGLRVRGFGTLPTGLNDFTITPGTYSVGASGTGHFVAGTLTGSNLNGTFAYDKTNQKYTLITGGTFTVALSGTTYTITTNFSGVDAISGQAATGLTYKFTGSLDFVRDYPTGIRQFSDIGMTNYVANGVPVYLETPGPTRFMSNILPVTDSYGSLWAIGGWAGQATTFTVYPQNGNIIIDNTYPVAHTSDFSIYGFSQAVAYNPDTDELFMIPIQRARLNVATRMLEFTDTYKGLPIFVGIVAFDAATGEFMGVFSDLYYNLKLTLSRLGTTATVSDPLTFSAGTLSANTAGSFVSGEKLVLKNGSSLKMFTPAQNTPSPIDRQFRNAARPALLEPMKIK